MIAQKKILIEAPLKKVWDVLVKPRYIRMWNNLPRGFGSKPLEFETVIRWPGEDDQFIEKTVTAIEPPAFLRLAYFDSSWNDLPVDPVTYTYKLEPAGLKTRLVITIGDFSSLENGEEELKKANKFLKEIAPLIKDASESA